VNLAGAPQGWGKRGRNDRTLLEIGVWGFTVAAGVGAVVAAGSLTDSSAFSLIIGVLVVSLVASTLIVLSHRRQHDAFSPLGLICLYNLATFATGAVYFYIAPWPGALQPYVQTDIAPAVALGAIGLLTLALGYWVNPLRFLSRVLPALPRDVASRRTFVLLSLLFAVGWLARAYQFNTGQFFYSDVNVGPTTGASWVLGTLSELPLVAAAYCGARYYFAKSASASYGTPQFQYYALLLVELAYNAPRGSRAGILTIFMMILVLRYYGLRKRPSASSLVAITAVAVIVVFPLLFAYRNLDTTTGYQQDLRGNLLSASESILTQSPQEAVAAGSESTFRRFSGVTSMAAILHYGPDTSGRAPGETLSWSYTAFLPRAIAPTKPNPGRYANEFAQTFAIAAPGPTTTSVSIPHVAELYLNYRLAGIVMGMFIIGSVYRLMANYFLGRRTDAVALAVYAVAAWPLVNSQESVIAGGVLGLMKFMVVLAITLLVISRVQHMWSRGRTREA
jgi:uncharacterized membrane protein